MTFKDYLAFSKYINLNSKNLKFCNITTITK